MKRIIALVAICMFTISFYAQKSEEVQSQPKHEISLWGSFGYSTLNYDLSFGDKKCKLGWAAGLGYNYYFNYHWSLGLGVEYSVLAAEAAFPNFRDNYLTPAPTSNPLVRFAIEARTADFKQVYDLVYLNVPITLQYQTDLWKRHKFYVAGGFKVGYALDALYSSEGKFYTEGYDVTQSGQKTGTIYAQKNHGFGSHDGYKNDETFDVNDINVMLTVEPGVKWRLSDKFSLYTGVFVDYGLTEIRKNTDNDKQLFNYNYNTTTQDWAGNYTINNALESQYARETAGINDPKSFTDKVSTISAGLKLKLGFAFGALRTKDVKEVVEAPKPLTFNEIDEIVSRNTDKIIQNQDKGINDIKDMLAEMLKKEKAEIKEGIRLETVREFELDKVAIRSVMNAVLQNNLTTLKNNPDINIRLVGHTDELGGNDYNYNLGMRRAQSIKDWLVSQGIRESRLTVTSKGNTQHEIPNKDEAARKYNRRVEFLIEK